MSRSKKRKRFEILRARVTPDEKRTIEEKAKAVGGVSALFRTAVLGYRPPKSKTETEALVRVMASLATMTGAVNKAGSVFNQVAREVNRGRDPSIETFEDQWTKFREEIGRDIAELRHLLMHALGQEPDRRKK